MPGDPSAFMATIDQSPSSTSQVSSWGPAPRALATQMSCSAGLGAERAPAWSPVAASNGS